MNDPFRTVAGSGESGFEIRGSEFLGHVAPARTVEAAESVVERVGEAYADAVAGLSDRLRSATSGRVEIDADGSF